MIKVAVAGKVDNEIESRGSKGFVNSKLTKGIRSTLAGKVDEILNDPRTQAKINPIDRLSPGDRESSLREAHMIVVNPYGFDGYRDLAAEVASLDNHPFFVVLTKIVGHEESHREHELVVAPNTIALPFHFINYHNNFPDYKLNLIALMAIDPTEQGVQLEVRGYSDYERRDLSSKFMERLDRHRSDATVELKEGRNYFRIENLSTPCSLLDATKFVLQYFNGFSRSYIAKATNFRI